MIISKNSYLVLGLNSDADEKILNKRYKELLNFLNIDEVGSYDNDFPFMDYKKIRTEENIKEAFHNLSNQHKKLYQTFFRFQLVDDKDEKCMSDIISGNYVEGSKKWLELFEETKKYHYLKNHIVGELLFYENKNKFEDLSFTDVPTTIVDLLHKLITSEGFWKEFKEIFNVQNEIAIREDMIESFKNEIPQFIAEHFFDISEEIGNSKLYKEFSKKFSISAKELDDNKNVTESIKNIEDTLKSIKDMNLSEELDEIIDGINEIIGEIKKLDKLGLENNSKIIHLKDQISRDVRSMGIALFNDHDDVDNATNFIEEAIAIAHSNSLREKLNKDIEDVSEISSKITKQNEKVKAILEKPILLKDLNIPIEVVKDLVRQGGKFVIYKQCVSYIIATQRTGTEIYFISPGISGFSAALKPTIITLLAGWRGFPWGPIYTLECLFSNIFGGKNVTDEIMQRFG